MKKKMILNWSIIMATLFSVTVTFAQGVWTAKANFIGSSMVGSVSFVIGTKLYVGTGANINTLTNSFWAYDATTNSWSQIASFPGVARVGASSFSIGNYGYVGLGVGITNVLNDFYRYDPVNDTWTQVSNFVGGAREGATSFSIGSYGYVAGGYNGSYQNDFWQYDPTTDAWTQKSNFSSIGRTEGVGFSIGNMGYFGTGWHSGSPHSDFWNYDPTINTWTQLSNFPGQPRAQASAFVIGNFAYVGAGQGASSVNYSDCFKYNPLSDTWTSVISLPFARHWSIGAAIADSGYIGLGSIFSSYTNDLSCFVDTNITTNVLGVTQQMFFSAFPNPATGSLYVRVPWNGEYSATIRTINGAKVRDILGQGDLCIERDGLAQGMYILTVLSPYAIKPESIKIVFTD
ncbi:MAG: hypothetical protein MUD00_01310 [Candidatus Pacebacteria bacterium]|jgi:N-acetylneuraminic acid mutarotase|nr:hypothetical protein [Candidatus Paceibacterota bacterium]